MFSILRRSTPEISVDELARLLRDGSVRLLDVREDWEYRRGHVPGALHIPLGQLAHRVAELERGTAIAVICQSGHRSLGATDFLLARGFAGAASVAGGTIAWARAGRRLEDGPARAA
jgi:rhodanese-related sulfurtransferase